MLLVSPVEICIREPQMHRVRVRIRAEPGLLISIGSTSRRSSR
jgi:hypothetical protein